MITKTEHFMALMTFVKANPEGKVEQAVTALLTDALMMMIVTGGPRLLAAIHAAGMTPLLIDMLGHLKGPAVDELRQGLSEIVAEDALTKAKGPLQ